MPFKTVERPDHDLTITVPYGTIRDSELPAYYRARLESGSLRPGLRELVDGRYIESFGVTSEGQAALVEVLEQYREQLEGILWGFIAPTQLAYGMFRMFQAQKADLPFESAVFRSPVEVAEWFGVPVEAIPDPGTESG